MLSLGFEDEDLGKAVELARQVLRGRRLGGHVRRVPRRRLPGLRPGQAVPLRHPSGAIDGIVIFARQATRRGSQREQERIALLERIGERLARSLELGVTLRHVADTLVPQFADHCFIDLFQWDKLLRRAQINARGWAPPPGTWASWASRSGTPRGISASRRWRGWTRSWWPTWRTELPGAEAGSLRASEEVGLTSIVAAPLVARGELLGVMSLALSRLTEREEPHYNAYDRDFLGAVASRVAIAIDNAMLFEEERRTALAFQNSLLPQACPARRPGCRLAVRARQAAGDPRPGNPDPGGR